MDNAIRILHLEDDAADRELIRARLDESGLTLDVTSVRTREEYETALAEHTFDLILADYRLPAYDGLSALRLARRLCPDVPFLFVSGTMGEDAAIEGLTEGATDYVLKERLSRLIPAVRRALHEAEDRRERGRAEESQRRLNGELRESEARYRSIFENSPLGISRSTFDGRLLEANPAFARMLGYESPGEVIREVHDMATQVYVQAEDRQRIVREQLQTVDTTQHLNRYRRKDGTEFTANLYLRTVRDAEGRPLHLEAIFEDITRRIEAEAALLASERRKGILNDIANAFLTESGDEMYARVLSIILKAMTSRLGFFGFLDEAGNLVAPAMSREGWGGFRPSLNPLILPPDAWDRHGWGPAVREQRTLRFERPSLTADAPGDVEHVLAVPVSFAEKPIGLVAVANGDRAYSADEQETLESIAAYVSPILAARLERNWQEQKRKLAEESLRTLSRAVEQSPASIVVTDIDGRIEYVNPKFTEVTGYPAGEVLGQNPRFLKSGEMPPEEYRRLWRTIEAGNEWRGEFHNRKKSGELYWELASISPIFDADGHITHYLAVKEDITDHKRLEEDLRQAQKMEAFGQLAGGVAHDFNNLLTVIQVGASLLRGTNLTGDQVEELEEIAGAADRAANLTRQLLTFSRRQAVNPKDLDLNELVANLTKMLQRVIGEHISLTAHYAAGEARVHADPGMLEQVLMNLAINARDAMPRGGQVSIRTENVVVDEQTVRGNAKAYPGAFLRLSVSDSGHGIPPEILRRIFEPFFTTKGVGRGTGLGLAIVFGIVEQHHGWIETESVVGAGTTFHIYLPAAPASVPDATPRITEFSDLRGTETVMIVEDEPNVRSSLRRVLEQHGYRVAEAENAPQALRLWADRGGEVDLVLTDIVMPEEMSGRELADRLRTQSPRLKVIYVSGYSDEVLADGSSLRGSPAFIEKPFLPQDLLRRVRNCLDGR